MTSETTHNFCYDYSCKFLGGGGVLIFVENPRKPSELIFNFVTATHSKSVAWHE